MFYSINLVPCLLQGSVISDNGNSMFFHAFFGPKFHGAIANVHFHYYFGVNKFIGFQVHDVII